MTERIIIQKKIIKNYSEVLDIKKRKDIVNILTLFYNLNKYAYHSSAVDHLDNQIIFFKDNYGFNNIFKEKRKIFINNLTNIYEDCHYKSLSLDKIILYLFSWTKDDLKKFYKINLKKSNNGYQSGGGSSNEYVLKYIESLSNIENFKKTKIFFEYLNKLNEEEVYFNYIDKNFNINELYYTKYDKFIDIYKLFLYLLNIDIKSLDKILLKIESFFVNFDPKKELLKHKINKFNQEFNNKEWLYKKINNKYDILNKFYKLFDNRLVVVNIRTTKNNYIRSITLFLYESSQINYNSVIYIYHYLDLYLNSFNKFGLDNTVYTKKILKKALNDIMKYIYKPKIKYLLK